MCMWVGEGGGGVCERGHLPIKVLHAGPCEGGTSAWVGSARISGSRAIQGLAAWPPEGQDPRVWALTFGESLEGGVTSLCGAGTSGFGGVFAQRGHSANYYVVYPGNTTEKPPTYRRMHDQCKTACGAEFRTLGPVASIRLNIKHQTT